MPANLENLEVATGLEKVSFHSYPRERQCQRMLKLPHSCTHLTRQQSNAQNSSSQTSTVCELLDFKKAEEPEIKWPRSGGSSRKQESSRKTSTSALWLCQSLWLCGPQQTGKFFKRWEYQTTSSASWESYMQVTKQQLEPDMEQWTGSKLERENIKAVYCHPAYLKKLNVMNFCDVDTCNI